MKLLHLSLFLIGCTIGVCTINATNESEKQNYRLNTNIEPIHYTIDVTPHFDSNEPGNKPISFDGICKITLKAHEANVTEITLHKADLDIVEQSLWSKSPQTKRIDIMSSDYNNVTQKYTMKLATPLNIGELYELDFTFAGKINEELKGFNRGSYQEGNTTKWFVLTQMQPSNARYAFPCFDEPQFKATFSIIVNRPAHFKPSLSNMPMISSQQSSPKLVREHFQDTPKMSTYLVAIVVSEFECRENAMKNFSVCAPPTKYKRTEYSFDFGQKMLQTYEKLFDYEYSAHMPKMTIAAAFPAVGGMENWGLIICGQNILVDSTPDTLSLRKDISSLIAHEQAHQWFGNLVTCDWWSDTWLNEGFATYFSWFGLAMVESDWGLHQKFLVSIVHGAFLLDTLDPPLEALSHKVETPEQVLSTFWGGMYSKGASIVRMFNYTLGDDKFVAGLRNYFKRNALKTAVPETLYAAFQTEVKDEFNVTEVFDSWITQPGYPVISVSVSSNRKHIEITQSRFFRNKTIQNEKTLWNVPLNWASNLNNSDFSYTKPMIIHTSHFMNINLNKSVDWIVFNVQQSGYYRVNYDDVSWSAIAKILHKSPSTIHVLNRAQILNDAFELAQFSYTNYENAINVADYLQYEIEYAPWSVAFTAFETIMRRFKPNELYIFEKFGQKLLDRVYKHLGFHRKTNHTHLDMENRKSVVKFACQFGSGQCIADARTEYDLYLKGNYTIPTDLAPSVYCTVIEHGSQMEWDAVWKILRTKSNYDKVKEILSALGCAREQNVIKKYLDLILTNGTIQKQYKLHAFESTLVRRQNVHLVLDFVIANQKLITGVFGSLEEVLSSIILVVSTQEEIDRIQRIIDESDGMIDLDDELDDAKSELKWAEKHLPIIKNAIKRNTARKN